MKLLTVAVVSAILVVSAALGRADVPEVLRVSVIPDENPTELLRIYTPFTQYLARELGMKVHFTPVVDYAATVEGLAAKKLDLVWYGGFTSVQAVRRTQGQATRLALREEDAEFKSVFIARPGSGIKTLPDLKGKTFAFGSVGSTSGHLMPRSFMLEAKVNPERDFKQVAYSGAHDATALWVESGKVDAGALDVFYTTPPYVDYVWTARGDLDRGIQDRITAAFLKLDYGNPEHRQLLDLLRTKKYIKANDADWKGIEEAAIAAGLLK